MITKLFRVFMLAMMLLSGANVFVSSAFATEEKPAASQPPAETSATGD